MRTQNRSISGWILGTLALGVAPAGCGALLGLDQFSEAGATTGSATSSGSGGATSSSSGVGGATASSSGTGGSTSSGSGTGGGGGSPPTGPWSKAFVGAANGTGVAADAKGNVFIAGTFSGAVTFPGAAPVLAVGESDVFLVKLKLDGSQQWVKHFGDAGQHEAFDARVDSAGNVVITGFSTTPIDFGKGLVPAGIFVAKIDGQGTTIWSVGGGGDSSGNTSAINRGTDLAIDAQDNVVVAGACFKTINFGLGDLPSPTGGQDMFVAKLQAQDGKALWAKRSTGDGIETMGGIALDSSDSIFVTGTSNSTNAELNGAGPYNCCGEQAPFIMKLGASGNLADGTLIGGFNGGYKGIVPRAIAVSALGESFIAGDFSGDFGFGVPSIVSTGGKDAFLSKVFAKTGIEWVEQIGGGLDQVATNMTMRDNGHLLAAGLYSGATTVGTDMLPAATGLNGIFLTETDPGGKHVWVKGFGQAGSNDVGGLAMSPDGFALVTGHFVGTTDFGSGNLSAPNGGAFIARIALP